MQLTSVSNGFQSFAAIWEFGRVAVAAVWKPAGPDVLEGILTRFKPFRFVAFNRCMEFIDYGHRESPFRHLELLGKIGRGVEVGNLSVFHGLDLVSWLMSLTDNFRQWEWW